MNGTHMNETQVDESQADVNANGGGGQDAERIRRLRMKEFMRDLVRQEGRMEAAELLGVNYRTLVSAEESGRITGRMGDALERLLGASDDPQVARLRERVDALEEAGAAGRRVECSCGGVAGQPRRDSGCHV